MQSDKSRYLRKPNQADIWPEACVSKLIEMYKVGSSYSEIARECKKISGHSYTRSAVSGKVSRLIRAKRMDRIFHIRSVNVDEAKLKKAVNEAKKIKAAGAIEGKIEEIKKEEVRRTKNTTRTGFRFDRSCGGTQPPLLYPTRQVSDKSTTLVNLSRGQCRGPVGSETGADQLFCGQPSIEGESYCPSCKSFLYRPESKSDRVYVSRRHLGL